ncbi:MAG: glycoside hydrolase family 92 protein, partial [Deltaproteobacteria bacterium]
RFEQRAGFWRNLYDEKTGFFRARKADGSFIEPFDPLDWNAPDYVEGTAWQYLWLVPHNPGGLAELLGGKEAAAEKLEAFFTTPEPEDPLGQYLPPRYYWHGNEPDLHAAYLFNHFGRPDLTQLWARNVMAGKYGTGPDGLAGNDDCGTLSAWYVLSAAGIFPMAATSLWEIGSPVFERVLFDAGGRSLEIRAPGASQRRLYVESARLDGRRLSEPRFDAAELGTASVLELAMREAPGDWR